MLVPQTVEQVKAETQTKLAEEQKRIVNLEYENNSLKVNVNTLNKDQTWLKGQVEFLKKYVFDDKTVIETEEDVAELQAFLEKKRKQKENENEGRLEKILTKQTVNDHKSHFYCPKTNNSLVWH